MNNATVGMIAALFAFAAFTALFGSGKGTAGAVMLCLLILVPIILAVALFARAQGLI